jgi:restriction system protein
MKKAGLLEAPLRGTMRITKRGLDVLNNNPPKIDKKFLEQFPEFVEFTKLRHSKGKPLPGQDGTEDTGTPEELLENAYQTIREGLAGNLLDQIKTCSPDFFESLVVKLLVEMGYGGNLRDAGSVIGKSGDGGIDGLIKEDVLGLDIIYIQAKRWDTTVSRPEIQKFAGALQGKKTKKGVFITTSSFTEEAKTFAETIENKIVLIDGNSLADHMIDCDIGVVTADTYDVKRLNTDFFEDP